MPADGSAHPPDAPSDGQPEAAPASGGPLPSQRVAKAARARVAADGAQPVSSAASKSCCSYKTCCCMVWGYMKPPAGLLLLSRLVASLMCCR